MFATLSGWLSFLGQRHACVIDMGLERIEPVAEQLDLIHFACPVVIVAGTNGKGSTICFLERLYRQAGYRVASYTSPHLLRFNERIKLNATPVMDGVITQAFEQIYRASSHISLSFFEFTTLAALLIFKQHAPDILLLEVGLGGRLDAVNVVEPDISIVTSIGIDHAEYLGDTRDKIAVEKAGIFRCAKPAICVDIAPPPSISKVASQVGAKLYSINKDFRYKYKDDYWIYSGIGLCQRLPLAALRCDHASSALLVGELLQAQLPLSNAHRELAIKDASLPGRFETVAGEPLIVLDVAHNEQAANYLAERLQRDYHAYKVLVVVGMLQNKDVIATLRPLSAVVHGWYCVDLNSDETADICVAASADYLVSSVCKLGATVVEGFSSVAAALTATYNDVSVSAKTVIVVMGSFHTVAAAKQIINFKE